MEDYTLLDTRRKEATVGKELPIEELAIEWEAFCKEEYERWSKNNPLSPFFLYNPQWEADNNGERAENWKKYMRVIGAQWWQQRGYKLIWPDSPKKSLLIEKLC